MTCRQTRSESVHSKSSVRDASAYKMIIIFSFKMWIRRSRKVSNQEKLQRLVCEVMSPIFTKREKKGFCSGTMTTCTCASDQAVATPLVT